MPQRHFDEELADLKSKLLRMAGLAEDQIDKALTALVTRDSDLAREVIERDHQVNTLDVEIDEECIQLLALHQPAARDLRLDNGDENLYRTRANQRPGGEYLGAGD